METHQNFPLLPFATYGDWLAWLEKNHAQPTGIWVKFAKKSSGVPSITYEEAREGSLIYGWIDGLKHGLDETYYAIRFTPRAPKGGWSTINRKIVEDLIKKDRMHAKGLAEVAAAKKDGRWEAAYDSQSTIQVPVDFQQALDKNPAAAEFFPTINSANRYAFLYRLQTAKRAETRAMRIEKFLEMLAAGETFH